MLKNLSIYEGMEVTFNITEDCNLRCAYCYELDKTPRDLPIEYARGFIDVLLNDPDPIGVLGTDDEWMLKKGLCLDFIGGDALMRPKLCRSILEYWMFASEMRGHHWAHRWRVSISTNGTLFGESEVQNFLVEFRKNISLGVSVDGCPEVHNLNRSNSMSAILKHWGWYMQYCSTTGIVPTTKSTLNRVSIPYLYKSLKFLHEELGLRYINQNFIFEPMGETEDDIAELDRQMEKCVAYVLDHRDDLYWGMLESSFQCGTGDLDKGWCGAGAMPALGINGKIYPCFRFLPHTMRDRTLDFYVGDVWNGFTHKERFQIVRNQHRSKISSQTCLDCKWEKGCAWCIGGAYSEKGQFYRPMNICGVHKVQAKWTEEYWRQYGGDIR